MVKTKTESGNLNDNLKRLGEISAWFESQKEVDVEEGLRLVKEAVGLIRASRERLKGIENEFEEIQKAAQEEEK